MRHVFTARIIPIGNSRGIRLPKELVYSLGTSTVTLEQTSKGILIKPASDRPPRSEWVAIIKKLGVPEIDEDWDNMTLDAVEPWEGTDE